MRNLIASFLAVSISTTLALAVEPISIHSPGFPPSTLDAEGRLVEDWGTLGVTLSGEGVADGPTALQAVKLDDVVPAAQATATSRRGPADPHRLPRPGLSRRAWTCSPCGSRRLADSPPRSRWGWTCPPTPSIGLRTVRLGGRVVLTLPAESLANRPLRDWGYCDEATSLPGWAKPAVKCDPAFRNIRAGMGGVPIVYRFAVAPKSKSTVVLGLCESHWAAAASGLCPAAWKAPPHKPSIRLPSGDSTSPALVFAARDENGDGKLEVVVRAAAGAPDRNPILNAIWIFPAGESPNLERLVSGALSGAAIRYVDVGGENDQSIYPPGKLEYRIGLPAGALRS